MCRVLNGQNLASSVQCLPPAPGLQPQVIGRQAAQCPYVWPPQFILCPAAVLSAEGAQKSLSTEHLEPAAAMPAPSAWQMALITHS